MELTDELVPREPFTHHYINLLLKIKQLRGVRLSQSMYLQSLVRVQLAHFKESLHISLRNDPRYLVHVLLSNLRKISGLDAIVFMAINLYTSFEASTTLEAGNSFPAMETGEICSDSEKLFTWGLPRWWGLWLSCHLHSPEHFPSPWSAQSSEENLSKAELSSISPQSGSPQPMAWSGT